MGEVKIDLPRTVESSVGFEVRDDGYAVTLPAQPTPGLGITIQQPIGAVRETVVVHTADGRTLGEIRDGESVVFVASSRRRGIIERFLDFVLRRPVRETDWSRR